MRVFGDDAAEIIPHPAHHKPRLGIAEIWQCALQIDLRALGDAEARTDEPAEPAADRRGGVDRQQTEETKHQPGADRLAATGRGAATSAAAQRVAPGALAAIGGARRRGEPGRGPGGARPAAELILAADDTPLGAAQPPADRLPNRPRRHHLSIAEPIGAVDDDE